MSEPLELKEFAVTALTKDLELYARRADDAQRNFTQGASRTRILGALTLITVLISSTRLDQIVLQFLDKPLDQMASSRLGLVITAVAVVFGAFTVWSARAVQDRGYLRAWVRYSLAAQTLRTHQHELELAWHRFSALSTPTENECKQVIDAIANISAQAKQAALEEVKNWAINVTEDLSAYVKGSLKITEIAGEAKKRTKLSG
jgi:hypothetical protein